MSVTSQKEAPTFSDASSSTLKIKPASTTKYSYVRECSVKDITTCQLCEMAFEDPCCMPCCNVNYCRDCIRLYAKGLCPNDRKPFASAEDIPANTERTLLHLLDNLEVFCTHGGQGGACDWKGPRGNLVEHITRTCKHVPGVCEPV